MKKFFAILGIVVLAGLYAATLITAIVDPTETMSYLAASVAATILIPVLLWFILMFFRITGKNGFDEASLPDASEGENGSGDASFSDAPDGKSGSGETSFSNAPDDKDRDA